MASRTPKNLTDTPFLKTMRERFQLVNEAESNQDQREQDDIAFENDEQWSAAEKLQRSGQQPVNGMPAVPARPTLVFNKVKEPVRQILNQERASDIGLQLVPADDFGDLGITPDDTEVLLREGLVRKIQRESHAKDARTWAFKRAVIAGRGYYIVRTRFLPGKTWDQEIYVDRIYNQAGVKLDPSHEKPDGSDADWGFIGTWMSWDKFTAEYPEFPDGKKNPLTDASEEDFIGMTEAYPKWYRQASMTDPATNEIVKQYAVRIVDYWYTERKTRVLAVMEDGTTFWEDELPKDATPADTRTVVEKQIKFCKIAGGFWELEKTDESGPDMPIVKVVGDEVLPYDEERRFVGVVRPAKDSNKGFNYIVSKQVEALGLSPLHSPILDPDAIEGYEPWYEAMNTRALPFRPYRSRDDHGNAFNKPEWSSGNADIYPMAQSAAMFDQLVKSATAVPDSTLGNVDPSLKSGKAIREVVQNAQMSTSNYMDNLMRSMQYEAQIINNKLYPIYGTRPGRLVRVLTGEGEEQVIAVGQPQQQELRAKAQKVAKLTKDARFNVIMKITKSSENRRQQFVEMMSAILGADPAQMLIAGDLLYKNMDIPESRQLAKRMRVMLAPPVQKLLEAEEQGAPVDPAAQAQIAQLQGQLQQLQPVLQQMQQVIETKQIENQAKIQGDQIQADTDLKLKQMEIERDLTLQRMKDATTIHVEEMKLALKGHELRHEAQAMNQEQAHDRAMTAAGQQHESQQQAQSEQHDTNQSDRAFAQSQVTAAQDAAREQEQTRNE